MELDVNELTNYPVSSYFISLLEAIGVLHN